MYQSIDETDIDDSVNLNQRRNRLVILFIILLGITGLTAIAYFSSSQSSNPDDKLSEAVKERETYLAAISTSMPDMRRARLTDFLNTYPKSNRKSSVNAILSTLNRYENNDWADISYIIFDNEISRADKLVALSDYESKWNPLLLGGREDDVARIRETLELEAIEQPSRKLVEPDPEPSVNQDTPEPILVGGAPPVQTYMPPVITQPVNPAPTVKEAAITPSRIARDRKPRYPKRALSRGVEAEVVIRLYINDKGQVDRTELVYSSAERYEKDFAKAAERAARRTRFYPKTIDGKPVAEIKEKRYKFTISN